MVAKNAFMFAPGIWATIPRKGTLLKREISPLNLDLLALTFLSFGYAQDKFCLPSMGTPLLQQITLRDKGVPRKIGKLR
jgi:hypothetical protein